VGTLSGLAPWIVYWILLGNVPVGVAALIALALALVSGLALGAASHARSFDIGSLAAFSALTVLTFTLDESFLRRWMLPLSIIGLVLVALTGALTGRPFAREAALAKRLASDKGMRIGLDGVQLLGGHGFTKEHPVERWYRDLRAIGVAEGVVLI